METGHAPVRASVFMCFGGSPRTRQTRLNSGKLEDPTVQLEYEKQLQRTLLLRLLGTLISIGRDCNRLCFQRVYPVAVLYVAQLKVGSRPPPRNFSTIDELYPSVLSPLNSAVLFPDN
ncbi:unnamed protein product [Dicrocoelium dendriticum]|nr:unnamed protein product [Dicrocoelium dendriticum]